MALGCAPPPPNNAEPASLRYRISGDSMRPTLAGQSQRLQCSDCQFEWLCDAGLDESAVVRSVCTLCGSTARATGEIVKANEVVMTRLRKHDHLKFGDLVAIDHQGKQQIKRIIGEPGTTITLDGLRLLVSGVRAEGRFRNVPMPWLLVDDNVRREKSRWTGSGINKDWKIYHHASVHDHDQSSAVMDDFPCNVSLARVLHPVDRLQVRGRVKIDEVHLLQVVMWTSYGLVYKQESLGAADPPFEYAAEDLSITQPDSWPHLTESTPIAIRVVGVRNSTLKSAFSDLQVYRGLEYRLRQRDDLSVYPMSLDKDEYFVVGDNVPVSVDSRNWGPIRRDQIMSRVVP